MDAADASAGTAVTLDGIPPTFLRAALHPNWAFHVLKHLHPYDAGRLEGCHSTVTPLLRVAAERMNDASNGEASKEGATLVVLGADRDAGWITWARELLLIYMETARTRLRARGWGGKKMVSVSERHSLVASGTQAGGVWSFGFGMYGKLGHADEEDEFVPCRIEALDRVMVLQVSAGKYHSMALTDQGGLFTWGGGFFGQLGHGRRSEEMAPRQVGLILSFFNDLPITHIAAGGCHSMAVVEGGSVYTWGSNDRGQLGLGDHDDPNTDTTRDVPALVPMVRGVIAVAAGKQHSFVLGRDGTVMACGYNSGGRLGLGDADDRDAFTAGSPDLGLCGVVDIDAGECQSLAVTAEGHLYSWGKGRAMGHGEGARILVPTKVAGGGIEDEEVVQIVTGNSHAMALTAAGVLYAWGRGEGGQLGHGDKEHVVVPRVVEGVRGGVRGMAAGMFHSLVVTGEGRVMACGYEAHGSLGLGAGVAEALTPTEVVGVTVCAGEGGGEGGREGGE
jgi:alpha-tubulin suppressor-like RCC1 family protein